MRLSYATFSAFLLTFMMLSALLVFALPNSSETELDDSNLADLLFTSARSSTKSFLSSGGSTTQSIDAEYIDSNPTGGWVIGSTFNQTLTYGTQTLSPTSPYTYGEFFLASTDDAGNWLSVFGADHSFGAGGLSSLNDITVDAGGEIIVTGFFYGEISFPGGGGPAAVISNTNTNYPVT